MDLVVSPINFNGKWESVYADKVVKEGCSKYILKQRIYHPFKNETEAEINKAVSAYPSGWTYGIWRLHPNGGQRNQGSITELYAARIGEAISPDDENYTPHELQLKIDNVTIDKQTFINNRFNDHFRLCDVVKLEKNKIQKYIKEKFPSEE